MRQPRKDTKPPTADVQMVVNEMSASSSDTLELTLTLRGHCDQVIDVICDGFPPDLIEQLLVAFRVRIDTRRDAQHVRTEKVTPQRR